MSSAFELHPDLYDTGWDRLPEPEDRDLRLSQVQSRDDWIVKLRFKQGDTNYLYGTGFYVNIPDAENHVILTAGHNLIDANRNLSQNLVILRPSKSKLPTDEIDPASNDLKFFISSSYKETPSNTNAENDYGVVLVPKTNNSSRRGFGFALKLGHDDLYKEKLSISGYRVETKPGQPVTSTGRCIGCREHQLEYKVKTERGLSGSAVFTAYKGHDTAIAIHNHGPERRGRGSRGTRLNEKVLEEIFDWINVGYRNKSLKVFPSPKVSPGVPDDGLYLRFRPDEEHGWVRLGHKELETSFDIFPAYAPTPNVPNNHLYVFRFQLPPQWPHVREKRWVLWDFVRQGVTLTSTLQDLCFPRIVWAPKFPTAFQIVLADPQGTMGELVEFRMQAINITACDIEMEDLDTPEVSFGKHVRNKRVSFNTLCLE
ncbi:hypothetical protein F5B21DRAFT_61451 [Xylaria acuta]|nr:hypothetical protein F5B21DRAFT_61451 [Xylaria acuta]